MNCERAIEDRKELLYKMFGSTNGEEKVNNWIQKDQEIERRSRGCGVYKQTYEREKRSANDNTSITGESCQEVCIFKKD